MGKYIRIALLFACLLFSDNLLFSNVNQLKADSIEQALNAKHTGVPDACKSCSIYTNQDSTHTSSFSNLIFVTLIVVLATVWLFLTYRKKYIIVLGSLVTAVLVGSFFIPPSWIQKNIRGEEKCIIAHPIQSQSNNPDVLKAPSSAEFESVGGAQSEFSAVDEAAEKQSTTSSSTKGSDSEFSSSGEFTDASSEFSSTSEFSDSATPEPAKSTEPAWWESPMFVEPLVIFIILGFIAWGMRYERFRKFKGLFLLASVFYLGFYRAACPCMISSFQNTVLLIVGQPVKWMTIIFFLMLLPASYLFGKVWCGWLCHLGALQEFLFRGHKIHILNSLKAQKLLKIIQIVSFAFLCAYLVLTKTNVWCTIDPFLVAYNLYSANLTGWILLGIMLLSSVLIDRPFCRAFCPVGLVLGWIALLPGARRLDKLSVNCINCPNCAKACNHHAMIHSHKKTYLNNQDCIMCGDCISSCKKTALKIQPNIKKINIDEFKKSIRIVDSNNDSKV